MSRPVAARRGEMRVKINEARGGEGKQSGDAAERPDLLYGEGGEIRKSSEMPVENEKR